MVSSDVAVDRTGALDTSNIMSQPGQDPSISSRDEYKIPLHYITECKSVSMCDLERCPMIVFVNSRSGGRSGEAIHAIFSRYLGSFQVVRS